MPHWYKWEKAPKDGQTILIAEHFQSPNSDWKYTRYHVVYFKVTKRDGYWRYLIGGKFCPDENHPDYKLAWAWLDFDPSYPLS